MFLAALCLAGNMYFEARGEPVDGQILVAEVTMNIAGTEADICATVFEDGEFSWTNDKDLAIKEPEAFVQSVILAYEILEEGCILCTSATNFHTRDVEPYWAKHMTLIGAYGNHVFYQE
jgi:spore germination cell wall hydrolase CwlJ-like protein